MLMYFNQIEIYIINVDPGCWFQIQISGFSIFFKWLLRTMRARCSRHAPGHDRRRTLGMDQNLSAMGPIRPMILVLFFFDHQSLDILNTKINHYMIISFFLVF
jgi:hypothetical protein